MENFNEPHQIKLSPFYKIYMYMHMYANLILFHRMFSAAAAVAMVTQRQLRMHQSVSSRGKTWATKIMIYFKGNNIPSTPAAATTVSATTIHPLQ